MQIRKLGREEHGLTRNLWEEVFREDTKGFLDYYYQEKVKENEIYVIELDGQIVSMLHLNPYEMRIGQEIYKTHYIVAVATQEAYRGRGMMTALINYVLAIMKERGEPFTFLMPAAETIYKPFGFYYAYTQACGKRKGVKGKCTCSWRSAKKEDAARIAEHANACLKEYEVVTWRTKGYYETLLAEQESENGGILLAEEEGKIVGLFCYAKGNEWEIREPLFDEKQILDRAIYEITKDEETEVFCTGYGDKQRPMIMVKELCHEFCPDFEKAKVFLNEVV